jgi:hypothetical protein
MNDRSSRRPGVSLFELLIVLALFAIAFAMMLPAVGKVREAAARTQSQNNLKQIAISAHAFHDVNNKFPSGVDANGFSAAAHLLPYIEQNQVYQMIDFKKPVGDRANAAARAVQIEIFLSPNDGIKSVSMDYGATNYLFCAGSLAALEKNNGVFFAGSQLKITDITDGTSYTFMVGETLKGDSMVKATDVHRQHVLLKKDALKGLKEDAGEQDWKDDKHIAADRCASWMDGSFLQGTFTATRTFNDPRPDVNCGGLGGWSGLRSFGNVTNVALCDGSVRAFAAGVKLETWKALATMAGGEVIDPKEF